MSPFLLSPGALALAALALAAPPQDPVEPPQDPPVPAPEAPASDDDDAAEEPPADAIPMLIEAAGGIENWRKLPGLCYEVLEAKRYLDESEWRRGRWKIHNLLPILFHSDLTGNGYALAEYVSREGDQPLYRRMVLTEGTSWGEQGGTWDRGVKSSADAAAVLRREFFLGQFPFCLPELGATTRYVRTDPAPRDREVWVYVLELRRGVRIGIEEQVKEYLLYVDPETKRALELRFRFFGNDRMHVAQDETWASVQFTGALEFAGFTLSEKRIFQRVDHGQRVEWWSADPRMLALPPEALRRPWFSGELWEWTDRADHWDPQPEQGPPVPEGGDDGQAPDG